MRCIRELRCPGCTGNWRRIWILLGVFLGYVLLTLLFTYPVVVHLGDHFAGRGNDLWIPQWNNWWVRRAWSEGLDVYYTPYMFYPQGVPLVFHLSSWYNNLLWLMLEPFFGAIAAHNLTLLLAYALSGYTMYLLAAEVTGSRLAAFLAGIVFAFFPHRHSHRNQINLFSVQWFPLVILYLIRLARTGRLWNGVWAGVALALNGLCSWQHWPFLGLWGGLWLAYNIIGRRWANPLRVVAGLAIAMIVCFLVVAPLLWPVVVGGLSLGEESLTAGDVSEGRTDLLAYFLPSPYHSLLKMGVSRDVYRRFVRFQGEGAALGYVVLGLALWAVAKRRKNAAFWGIAALFFAVLALGSVLQVNGRTFPVLPMPYRPLASTLLGQVVRRPARFNIIMALPMAMLAAIGAADLLARLATRRWWSYAVFGCLIVLVLFEYMVAPFPTTVPVQSDFFERLRHASGQFAVADFPIHYHRHDKWYMYAQTLHQRPMVGGHVSRVPAHARDFIDSVPLLTAARVGPPGEGELERVSLALRPLAEAGVRYVMIHKYRASPDEVSRWREWFAFQPHYEDDYLLVYRTAPQYGEDLVFTKMVAGIGVITATLSEQVLAREGVFEVEIVWGTAEPPERDWRASLALVGPDGRAVQAVDFEPCAGWPTSEWGENAVVRGRGALQVDPFVEDGTYTVTVVLVDPRTGEEAGEPAAVGQVIVQAVGRQFALPTMGAEAGARFGDVLWLLGYDLQEGWEGLHLALHWQALRRMEVSYKFFVHLYDIESGALAAQADVVPHAWTYPTTWWEEGEVVSDVIVLPLGAVSPGRYRLAVGVYDPQMGERLPITELPPGFSAGERRLFLPEEIVMPLLLGGYRSESGGRQVERRLVLQEVVVR